MITKRNDEMDDLIDRQIITEVAEFCSIGGTTSIVGGVNKFLRSFPELGYTLVDIKYSAGPEGSVALVIFTSSHRSRRENR
jgi:hypothetical protein